jgi:exodeoxyribonuclease VII small subunit
VSKKEMTYTQAYAELADIVASLQNDNTDIDALAARIERANELIRFCRERLRQTEEMVQKLTGED